MEIVMGGILIVFLLVYALTGGADFGGGVWDLLASGPRAAAQRHLIARAIGPIWEANHVWLIAMIVVMFVDFPRAFATMATALHIPLTIMLFGIVLRGSAFVFRTYDSEAARDGWSRVFALSSVLTPIMLGVCLATMSGGRIKLGEDGKLATGFVESWWQPFPWAVGLMTLCMVSFLAATYLVNQTDDAALRDDFRIRALGSGIAVGVMAWVSFLAARTNAPFVAEGLLNREWSIPFHVTTALVAFAALTCLWGRRFGAARVLAGIQTVLIILGWAFTQFPYLVYPDLTIANASAPESVLSLTFWTLLGGSVLLIPSFFYLYRIFFIARD